MVSTSINSINLVSSKGDLMKYLIIMVLMLNACGNGPLTSSEDAIYEQVADFEKLYDADAAYISIDLVDSLPPSDKGKMVGLCTSSREIKLLKGFWDKQDELGRKVLLFHELGHCYFGRIHRDDKYPDGCPKSIMSTMLISVSCFLQHRSELIAELP